MGTRLCRPTSLPRIAIRRSRCLVGPGCSSWSHVGLAPLTGGPYVRRWRDGPTEQLDLKRPPSGGRFGKLSSPTRASPRLPRGRLGNAQRVREDVENAWKVLRRAVAEARDDRVTTTAQALAYSLFLAIPAAFLVLLGLFSVFADAGTVAELVSRAGTMLPTEATTLLEQSLERATQQPRRGVLLTVLGLGLGLWTTTSAATTLMQSLTTTYDRQDSRGFVRKRVVAFAIVVTLALGASLVLGLLVFGPHLEHWVGSATDASRSSRGSGGRRSGQSSSAACSSPSLRCSTLGRT